MRGRITVADPDFDGDGWSDYLVGLIGTYSAAACPSSEAHSAWPADINNDGFSDISDIVSIAGDFVKPVPPASARYNVAPDPPDGFIDVRDITKSRVSWARTAGRSSLVLL